MGYEIKIDDVCMWILLLPGTSIKTPCCWAQMTFVYGEPALNRRMLLLLNCDAQWRIHFLISACIKRDAMCRDTHIWIWIARAGDVCVVLCNMSRVIWICAIPVQSLECNNRGLFFGTLLKYPFFWIDGAMTFLSDILSYIVKS